MIAAILIGALAPGIGADGITGSPIDRALPGDALPAGTSTTAADKFNSGDSGLGALNPGPTTGVGGEIGLNNQTFASQETNTHFIVESSQPAYWRTGTYGLYTGAGWQRESETDPYSGEIEYDRDRLRGERITYTVQLKRPARSVPTAWRPKAVSGLENLIITDSQAVRSSAPLETGTKFEAVSYAPPRDPSILRTSERSYPTDIRQRYTQLPEDTPERVSEFTDEIAPPEGGPYQTAISIQQWLRNNKQYSLSASTQSKQIADSFIFDMDTGYCEYFATAMTVMLRSQDIPARYVVGYSTGDQVDSNTYEVRAMNAHAWVEVYFEGSGWVRFDPTPGGERLAAQQQQLNEDGQQYNPADQGSPGESFDPGEVTRDSDLRDALPGQSDGSPEDAAGTVANDSQSTANGSGESESANATDGEGGTSGRESGSDEATSGSGESIDNTRTNPGSNGNSSPEDSVNPGSGGEGDSESSTGDGSDTDSEGNDETDAGDPTETDSRGDSNTNTGSGQDSNEQADSESGSQNESESQAGDGGNSDSGSETESGTEAGNESETGNDDTATEGDTEQGSESDGSDSETDQAGDESDKRPEYEISLDQEQPVPGESVEVTVTLNGEPVADVEVLFNGESVGRTDRQGRLKGVVPFADELRVIVRQPEQTEPAAVGASAAGGGGRLAGVVAIGRQSALSAAPTGAKPIGSAAALAAVQQNNTYNINTNASVSIVGEVLPGEDIVVVATVDDAVVPRAEVTVDDAAVGQTGQGGRANITLPDDEGEVDINVSREAVSGGTTVRVPALSIAVDTGTIALPFSSATVTATYDDRPAVGVPVFVDGEQVTTTSPDGTATVRLSVQSSTIAVEARESRATKTVTGLLRNLMVVMLAIAVVTAGPFLVGYYFGYGPRQILRLIPYFLRRSVQYGQWLLITTVTYAGVTGRRILTQLRTGLTHLRALLRTEMTVGELLARFRKWLRTQHLKAAAIFNRSSDSRAASGEGDERQEETIAIRDAWARFLRYLSLSRRQMLTSTPDELARYAVEKDGLPERAVKHLRDAFRGVEYGSYTAETRLERVQQAIEEIEDSLQEDSQTADTTATDGGVE